MKALTATLLFGAAIALAGCGENKAPQTGGAPEVGIVTIAAQPVSLDTELSGRTTAYQTSEVRPQVAGIIKALLFKEGSQVSAGQALYQIDPAPFRAAYDQAQAALANAQANLAAAKLKSDRYAELVKIEAVSKQDADDALAAYKQADASVAQQKAAVESAKINLDYTRVTAPISGRIGKSSSTVGALVTANQTTALATIQKMDPMYVDLTQSSTELLKLKASLSNGGAVPASASVRLTLENGAEYPIAGRLQFTEVTVDPDTGSVTLRAAFPNPQGLLLPGMYVRARLAQAMEPEAILAPQQGVARDPKGRATALVVGAGNKVESRELTVDRVVGDKWLVTSGLKAGDRLIVEGTDKVKAGETVKPVAAGSPAPTAAAAATKKG
ncbi:efflux RND transporter periplasmic adaptor subunit [Phenylobacterium sp.]|uniref:efflux RND transporter periplasmic adaptor subunit n=1 Tax=Phenylobacterium sp. TaxID=1871053 RepID=UPI0035B29860